ncbi:amidase [Halomonas huangheensis]|uniref:Amidase domain-containing protein n=1 Tax=Halomonas huangheensis TaxID=1178482 RepID=W1N5X0_9GAMM|nr:amidase [Halomonas huangheensis]ALM54338.1 hypothetical protein AR456_20240 [Halomonas huangheensis]ERL50899.1 hypothetical protein BJB45_20080 [Halomonas huangheensis]
MTELLDQSIREQLHELNAGHTTAQAILDATLDRIRDRNQRLHAYVHIDESGARAQAQRIDQLRAAGLDTGPLGGIPVALKDLIDAKGQPGYCGSHAFDAKAPEHDAEIVARLRGAGAIILGKVATYEFALNGPTYDQPYPIARNPWNLEHITGGSSSGSASAVAGGTVRAAIGTDTGGSVRSPASYCGIVGLKPSTGLLPLDGVFPLSQSLDTLGVLAMCVDDAAILLDAMSAQQGQSAAASRIDQPVSGLTIGYARDWITDNPNTDPAVIDLLDAAASSLSLLGMRVTPITMPDYPASEEVGRIILLQEAFLNHQHRLGTHGQDYGEVTREVLMEGASINPTEVSQAREMAQRLRTEVDDVLNTSGIIMTATTLGPAPPLGNGKAVWTPMRTIPFNITGHPAISIPCGFIDGLPIGLQLIGRHGDEASLCQIAHAFEQSTAHSVQRPPTHTY